MPAVLLGLACILSAQLDTTAPDVAPAPLADPAPEFRAPTPPAPDATRPPAVEAPATIPSWRTDLAQEPESRALLGAAPVAVVMGLHIAVITLVTGAMMGATALPLVFLAQSLVNARNAGDAWSSGITEAVILLWVVTMPVMWLPVLVAGHLLSGVMAVLAPVAGALAFRMVTHTHRLPRAAFLGGTIAAGLAALAGGTVAQVLAIGSAVGMAALGSLVLASAGSSAMSWVGILLVVASPLPLFALPVLGFTSLLLAAAAETGVAAAVAAARDPVPVN
jgi:hypothetical protein